MNYYKLAILFSCIIYLALVSNKRYFYTTPLSLNLIQDGVHCFITEAKEKSEKDRKDAIQGMIACASKNQMKPKQVLQELHDLLKYRIERIEFQLKHKRLFNRKDLAFGSAWIVVGIGLSALEYCAYNKWVKPATAEKNQIEQSIKHQNGQINIDHFNTISVKSNQGTHCSPAQQVAFDKQSERLAQLYNHNENWMPILLFSTSAPISAIGFGIWKIIASFRPNSDNHNLEYYKSLQALVEKIQKEHIK